MSMEEKASFLSEYDREEHVESHQRLQGRWSHLMTTVLVATNTVLLVLCIVLGATVLSMRNAGRFRENSAGIPEPYSPANSIIEYEQRNMIINDTRFTGPPSSRWEDAMHKLLEGTLLRVSETELQKHGFDSIPLLDGGYGAGLGVAHNLHCVKKIKMLLYPDYFYSDLDRRGDEYAHIQEHADHCLDWIRQSLMCHADFSMYTLQWAETGPRRGFLKHNEPGVQRCVNWDSLHDWMKSRSANTDMLQRPTWLS